MQEQTIETQQKNDHVETAVSEQAKEELVLRAYEPGPYRKCIYAGILDRLEMAQDLAAWHYKDKDDLFYEVIEYLWSEGAANILTTPAKASMETRLRKLAYRHTQMYVTELIRSRNKVKKHKYKAEGASFVSEEELQEMKNNRKSKDYD
jgi:hypothetical protein